MPSRTTAAPPSCLAHTGDRRMFAAALATGMANQFATESDHDEQAVAILSEHLKLTRRQAEVLHWMAEGKTNDEIATILACRFYTVKAHTKEIYQRLDVHTRTAAAACAYRAHLAHLRRLQGSPEQRMPRKKCPPQNGSAAS